LGVEFLLRAQSIFDRAVIDDLGAILVIAIFYETIAFINLFIAFAIMGLFILNRRNVHLFPYLIGGCHVVFHAKFRFMLQLQAYCCL
jgi:Na+/H+ antiporter NhaA